MTSFTINIQDHATRALDALAGRVAKPRPLLKALVDGMEARAEVHPHAGGEHAFLKGLPPQLNGSSPRGWGTRRPALGDVWQARFIPTRVGNTRCVSWGMSTRSVHPHAGGEHRAIAPTTVSPSGSSRRGWGTHQCRGGGGGAGVGSSPRGWGTHRTTPEPGRHRRFIPTRVGNTTAPSPSANSATVHPHAGGEHSPARRT